MNSGILLSDTTIKDLDFNETDNTRCFYNFPSSFIDLDVAREKILSFKNKSINKKDILAVFVKQGTDLINSLNFENAQQPLILLNNIYHFFKQNKVLSKDLEQMKKGLYCLNIQETGNNFSISLNKGDRFRNYVNADFRVMTKIYFKILFRTLKLESKVLKMEDIDFESCFKKLNSALDLLFKDQKWNNSELKYRSRYEEELYQQFNDDYYYSFNNQIHQRYLKSGMINKFDEYQATLWDEFMHARANEGTDRFDNDRMHRFDIDSMHRFNLEVPNISDNGIFNMIDQKIVDFLKKKSKYVPQQKNIFSYTDHQGDMFSASINGSRESDKYYSILSNLIFTNYLNKIKRGKGGRAQVGNINILFYIFYGLVVRETRICDVINFGFEV